MDKHRFPTPTQLVKPPKRGFNYYAETEGFEPSRGVNPYLLSREAHSTWLCDVSSDPIILVYTVLGPLSGPICA